MSRSKEGPGGGRVDSQSGAGLDRQVGKEVNAVAGRVVWNAKSSRGY